MPTIEFDSRLSWLLESGQHRYKVLYGGRGGLKSWGMARALLLIASKPDMFWRKDSKPVRVLCAREFQNSIAESVHALLATQIELMGLPGFEIQRTTIRHGNGSEFIFVGLRHNVSAIKSLEGVDILWCEEAEAITNQSWDIAIPTIRKPGSEIWVSFNPALDTDATYQRFVVQPPPSARVEKYNYKQNKWLPKELAEQAEFDRQHRPDEYRHIWMGEPRSSVEGAIYELEIAKATEEGRLRQVPYDRAHPVHTAWDLGYGDATAVWMWQHVGMEIRILDYYETTRTAIADIIAEIQRRGYVWGDDYLPWDGGSTALQTGQSMADKLRQLGRRPRVVPQHRKHEGIDAVRTLFPRLWIDSTKCADGLQALRHYSYEKPSKSGEIRREPKHDWASHGADALRTLAMGIRPTPPKTEIKPTPVWTPTPGRDSWMA